MTSYLGDLHELQTADGLIETFGGGTQAIEVYGGYGMPPINYITVPNLNRVGFIERDYTLLARPMTMQLWVKAAATHDAYWNNRNRLHDLLRPNRGGELLLTIQLPNMARRSIYVRANPGIYTGEPNDNSWLIDEPLELLAHNPIWFDGESISASGAAVAITELVFPITFPITFGSAYTTISTGQFVYQGTWETYPTITLTGPYTSAQIVNSPTGATINLVTPINIGDTRIISLEPGNIRVYDGNGELKFSEVDPLSDFVHFQIKPAPEYAGGVNEVLAILLNGSAGYSTVTVSYNNRYIGV